MILLDAEVNGTSALLRLDTGATVTVVSRQAAGPATVQLQIDGLLGTTHERIATCALTAICWSLPRRAPDSVYEEKLWMLGVKSKPR